MDFHTGSPVLDRHGEHLGSLKHVIIDPNTKEVAEIVVDESGMLGRSVVISIGAVDSAEHEGIRLELAKDQVATLPDFETTRYLTPDTDSEFSSDYGQSALMANEMMPVGAASGMQGVAYTPIVETTDSIPEGDVDLKPGMEVWATDGKVGSIRDVLVDEQTRRMKGFVIQEGFLFHKDVEVALDQVATFGPDRVTLKVAKAELAPA